MRLDRHHWHLHSVWGVPSLLVVAVMAVWCALAGWQSDQWPRGGSLPAFSCGVLAAAIVLFEMLLGLRKRLRAWRLLPARHWMAAHLWLGLASLPLALLHSGFHFGGWLPSLLLCLLLVAQVSGWFGWLLQHIVPSMMLRHVPSETITSEIETVSQRSLAELRLLLTSQFGPAPHALDHEKLVSSGQTSSRHALVGDHPRALTIGAMREPRRVHHLANFPEEPDPQDADKIWDAFAEISTFVVRDHRTSVWLRDKASSNEYFGRLRAACDRRTGPVIDAMQVVCDQRRQHDLQKRLHGLLVSWIPLHITAAAVLTVLLVVHIFTALRYW